MLPHLSRPHLRLPAAAKRGAVLVATAVAVLAGSVWSSPPAGAATTSRVAYSTDGGATWTSSATVAPGSTVQVRQWFSNTGTDTIDGAALTTSLPIGFTPVAGSTEVCLNPSTTDPAAPVDTELACAGAADSVWSGAALAVSPSAGHFGDDGTAAAGPLAAGRKRYLNLHQCVSWTTDPSFDHTQSVWLPSTSGSYSAATNVSNTAGPAAPTCFTDSNVLQTGPSGVSTFDLFDRRYLNLRQCRWANGGAGADARAITSIISGTADPQWSSGSATTNTPGGTASCADPAGPWAPAPVSGQQDLDILEDRYIHLHTCWFGFRLGTPSVATAVSTAGAPTYGTGTASSDSTITYPDIGADCTVPWDEPDFLIGSASGRSFDLLDTQRSAGYVAYTAKAPTVPAGSECATGTPLGLQTATQTASLAAAPAPTASSTGTLTIDWGLAPEDPCGPAGIPLADPSVLAALSAALVAVAVWRVRLVR